MVLWNGGFTVFNLAASPGLVVRFLRWVRGYQLSLHVTQEAYAHALKRMVTKPGKAGNGRILFVSIGAADFLTPWLRRLYSESSMMGGQSAPRLHKLVIKRLDDTLARKLESDRVLESGFTNRMLANIQALRDDCHIISAGVNIEERIWSGLPPFHGFLCEDRLLIGNWSVNDGGLLHNHTPLVETNKRTARELYDRTERQFDTVVPAELETPASQFTAVV